MTNNYIIDSSVLLDFALFLEYLNYSGIEYKIVGKLIEAPTNFETCCFVEFDNMNFNLLQLKLPDDFDLLPLMSDEDKKKNKSSNYYYITQTIPYFPKQSIFSI
jgi:hypothetical protein